MSMKSLHNAIRVQREQPCKLSACLFLQMHLYIAALRGFTSTADSLICKFQTRLLQITDPYDQILFYISHIRLH